MNLAISTLINYRISKALRLLGSLESPFRIIWFSSPISRLGWEIFHQSDCLVFLSHLPCGLGGFSPNQLSQVFHQINQLFLNIPPEVRRLSAFPGFSFPVLVRLEGFFTNSMSFGRDAHSASSSNVRVLSIYEKQFATVLAI